MCPPSTADPLLTTGVCVHVALPMIRIINGELFMDVTVYYINDKSSIA
jgi:hypothetical protein